MGSGNQYSRRGDEDRHGNYYRPTHDPPHRDRDRDRNQDRDRDRDRDHDRDHDRDRSAREREHERERHPGSVASASDPPREQTSQSMAASPILPSSRKDSTGSTKKDSVMDSTGSTKKDSVAEAMSHLLRTGVRIALTDRDIKAEQKVQETKLQEYTNTSSRNTEYPSVPEYRARQLREHKKKLAQLEEKRKLATADHDKTMKHFVSILAGSMSSEFGPSVEHQVRELVKEQTKNGESRVKALEDAYESAVKKHTALGESKMKALKEFFDTALKEQLAAQKLESEKTLADQDKLIKKLLEGQESLERQIKNIEKQKNTERVASPQAQAVDIKTFRESVSKISLIESNVGTLQENVATRTELETLRKDCTEAKTVNAKLATELKQVHDKADQQGTDLTEYTEMTRKQRVLLDAHEERLFTLSRITIEQQALVDAHVRKIQAQEQRLSTLQQITDEHKNDLTRLDVTTLEQVAEGWSMDCETIKDSITKFQEFQNRLDKDGRLEQLERDLKYLRSLGSNIPNVPVPDRTGRSTPNPVVPRQSSVMSTTPKDATDSSWQNRARTVERELSELRNSLLQDRVEAIERELGELRNADQQFKNSGLFVVSQAVDRLTTRVKRLEEGARTSQPNLGIETPAFLKEPFLSAIPSLVDTMKALGDKVDELEKREEEARASLIAQRSKELVKVEEIEKHYEELRTTFASSLDYLNTQLTALDTQYNNINTKPLAESVLMQMERIYPTNQQVLANQQHLTEQISALQAHLDKQSKQSLTAIEDLKRQWNSNSSPNIGPGNKRRRTEEVLNQGPSSRGSTGSPRQP